MRKLLTAVLVVAGVLLGLSLGASAAPLDPAQIRMPPAENLTGIRDDYTTTAGVNVPVTTAEVDTSEAKVMLPVNPCAVSFRPGVNQVAVKDTDCIKIYASGTAYIEQASLPCPGVVSVSYSNDGRFLYACTEKSVHKYAATEQGYEELASTDTAQDLVAVEGGKGHEVWVLRKRNLERWLGAPDGGYSPVSVAALSEGKSLSYSGDKNSVAVLDGGQIRYFAVAGDVVEIDKYRTSVGAAIALAQTESAIRVLLPDGSRYYSVQPDGLSEVAGLASTQKGFAVASPNGKSQDFVVLGRGAGMEGDLNYHAFAGSSYTDNPSRDIGAAVSEVGYKREAVLVSSTFATEVPVERLRAVLEQTVPNGTSVRLDVSTDGGVTWTVGLSLDEVCDVEQGSALTYRLVLTTTDPSDTPIVEAIELLQVVRTQYSGAQAGTGKVRLVP